MIFRKTVTCGKCGVVLLKKKAYKTIVDECEVVGWNYGYVRREKYYCLSCVSPSTCNYIKHPDYIYDSCGSVEYYKSFRVDENGEPIGYVRKNENEKEKV